MPKLTVSIVLYKTPIEDIRKCLTSLELFGDLYLYLVDNSPTDQLQNACTTNLPNTYLHLPENPGFGTAHNVAMRHAKLQNIPYHLVINADICFKTDVITPMLNHMNKHPEIGHMMPKVLNSDGTVQRLCKLVPTPYDLLWRRFSNKDIKASSKQRFELHMSGYDKIMFVPYLSGCFMLLRQTALQDVGLFDERYFMYPEDIDLTRRIAERYETIFFPEVSVTHGHGAASYKSFKMLLVHAYNLFKYFNKWGWLSDPSRGKLNRKTLDQFAKKLKY